MIEHLKTVKLCLKLRMTYNEIATILDVDVKKVRDLIARDRLHAPIIAPDADKRYVMAQRLCLKCGCYFESEWSGNRVCPDCRNKVHTDVIEPDGYTVQFPTQRARR